VDQVNNTFENTALHLVLQLASIPYRAKFSQLGLNFVNFVNCQSFSKNISTKYFDTRHTVLTL